MRTSTLARALVLGALVQGLAAVAASAAPVGVELAATLGATGAILGDVSGGGASASFSGLWIVEDRLAFGGVVMADDLGSNTTEMFDPATGASLGVSEQQHRAVYGAAWRLDVRPREDLAWRPYATGSWGWSLVRDDVRGSTLSRMTSAGFTLGGGVRHAVRSSAAFGIVFNYHRLFNDRAGRFVSAGLEWSWR